MTFSRKKYCTRFKIRIRKSKLMQNRIMELYKMELTYDIENSLSVYIPQGANKELITSVFKYPVYSKHTIFAC